MRRREFIAGLGSAPALWVPTAQSQQPAIPIVGFVNSATADGFAEFVAAYRDGLNELGYVEGRNLAIEYRWANGDYDRLPQLIAELVQRRVAVIASTGGTRTVLAAKAATATIPIVFEMGGDPVELGIVKSLNRPEGNITGIRFFQRGARDKRWNC